MLSFISFLFCFIKLSAQQPTSNVAFQVISLAAFTTTSLSLLERWAGDVLNAKRGRRGNQTPAPTKTKLSLFTGYWALMRRGEGEHQPSPSTRSSHQRGQIRVVKAQKSAALCAQVSATLPSPGIFCRHFNQKLLALSLLPVSIARHGKNKYGVDKFKKKTTQKKTFVILIGRQSPRALHRGTIVPPCIPPTLARSGRAWPISLPALCCRSSWHLMRNHAKRLKAGPTIHSWSLTGVGRLVFYSTDGKNRTGPGLKTSPKARRISVPRLSHFSCPVTLRKRLRSASWSEILHQLS